MPSPCQLKTPLAPDLLRVQSCVSREGISELGEMQLVLLSEKKDIAPDELLGKPVTLTLAFRDDAKRHLNGYVARFAQGGFEGKYFIYEMTLRPWLWLLTRTTDCRIFQDMTVPDIVKSVFNDHPVARFEQKLFRSYRPWTYCVQYRETDFNFVARLLEHEGIYWFFDHSEGDHKLVLCDSASAHDAAPGCESLPFYGNVSQAPPLLEHVNQWAMARHVKPGKVVITDYDFERPSASLETNQTRSRSYDLSDGEVFDYPGGYIQTGHGSQYAEDRLDEMQAQHEVFSAGTNAQGVCTGSLLKLTRHPRDDQNAEYLITSTQLQVRQPANEAGEGGEARLMCGFGAIISSQQYRPPRRTPKPQVAGPQTATVTGPAGEEIFTDKYGRVKVQFHWDRRGQRDEKSSCWVSVAYPWAGSNFGGIHIPRIGQEVVVSFLEGDPDAPLIVGRTYNGENLPPWDLPANATQSGFLTRSSKGGGYGNANAIRFEDKAGSEQLWIHAEKNQDIEVENDETHWVGHDRKKTIDNDETTHVKHDRTETVDNNETITIGVDRTEKVGSNEKISIGANRTEDVGANETITITANRTESVGGNETISVTGNRTITVSASETASVTLQRTHLVGVNETIGIGGAQEVAIGGLQSITVGAVQSIAVGAAQSTLVGASQSVKVIGSQSVTVGTGRDVKVGAKLSTVVGADEARSVAGKRATDVGGDDTFNVTGKVAVSAGDSIALTAGDASITLKKDGTVIIKGKDITLDASGKINLKAGGDIVTKGSNVHQN
ncbi:MAG TPA: type VI secretion system tip protein TssI/VgrG [Ideonella sp.]|uniref:type VI secretion system Vgr family protein n=1 Tax=Ideonella sp. TaxID=1929293 RepID=UPI002E34BA73|nr:type VI secretion system tip protein TssI/VgrG [Ideonella sp.]HEX5686591.1 type VI secretion system tip protein TssI/VgrG [Ideonella sp.]